MAGLDQGLTFLPAVGHGPLVAVQAVGVGQVVVPAQGSLVIGHAVHQQLHIVGAVLPFGHDAAEVDRVRFADAGTCAGVGRAFQVVATVFVQGHQMGGQRDGVFGVGHFQVHADRVDLEMRVGAVADLGAVEGGVGVAACGRGVAAAGARTLAFTGVGGAADLDGLHDRGGSAVQDPAFQRGRVGVGGLFVITHVGAALVQHGGQHGAGDAGGRDGGRGVLGRRLGRRDLGAVVGRIRAGSRRGGRLRDGLRARLRDGGSRLRGRGLGSSGAVHRGRGVCSSRRVGGQGLGAAVAAATAAGQKQHDGSADLQFAGVDRHGVHLCSEGPVPAATGVRGRGRQ